MRDATSANGTQQLFCGSGQLVTGEKAVSDDKTKARKNAEQTAGCLFASTWAMLLARIYEINPLVCLRCGGEMRIIAFVTELESIGRILRHIRRAGLCAGDLTCPWPTGTLSGTGPASNIGY
ncbi:MAG: hypothetical protein GY799_10580 [Desulfobulbaceae bacterium]|nr:hypothetical protein [Desulfobulbaceae bacterium]